MSSGNIFVLCLRNSLSNTYISGSLIVNIMSVNGNNIKTDVVPWALPGEDIPFSVVWPNPSNYDKIKITTPNDIGITKLVNVLDYRQLTENSIEINKVKQVEGGPGYFGGTAVLRPIPTELKSQRKIDVKFLKKGQVINEKEILAKVFRPHLELIEHTTRLELRPDHTPPIQLSVKYSGFGDVVVHIIGTINGERVTRRVPFDLTSFEPFLTSPRDTEALKNKTEENLEAFLYSKVNTRTLDQIIGQIDRHPIDNVWLADAQTQILITKKLETVDLSIVYSDIMGNTYPKLEVPIQIESFMEPSNNPIIIPIRITKWEFSPFLNVEEIEF